MVLVLLSVAILPAVLLWIYIWQKDPKKEPTRLLMKAVAYGIGVLFVVGGIEVVINSLLFGEDGEPTSLFGTTAKAFLVAAIPEEAFKLLALWLVLRKNPYFDEHFDGIVYAVSIGLGFAAIENIAYVVGGEENWVLIAVSRALLAVPGHYAFAILMGYFYSVYHFSDKSSKNRLMVILAPVLAHGIYDALALSGNADPIVGSICAFVLIYFCIKMHKFAYKKIVAQIERDSKDNNITV